MKIGCVKEIKNNEFRVGITPGNVKEYAARGHRVLVEKGAGEGSGFPDEAYAAAGALLLPVAADVWAASEMIVKVKEPLEQEYPYLRRDLIVYTYLHLAAAESLTRAMLSSGCKGVAYETLTDKNGSLPLLAPMSQIAGRLSVIEGAKYMEKPFGGSGVLISGVPGVKNAKVVILGGGVVGTNACRLALGLGADVTIMDVSLQRLAQLDDQFGGRVKTVFSTTSSIEEELAAADLVIGAVLIPGASAPKLIRKSILSQMRQGCVFVDVAVDQGGCAETTRATTHQAPTYTVDGVLHYCVANMPGAVSHTSTKALTNATLKYGLMIADLGLEEAAKRDAGIQNAINIYRGACTCRGVAEAFGLPFAGAANLM